MHAAAPEGSHRIEENQRETFHDQQIGRGLRSRSPPGRLRVQQLLGQ
jgi:hypothetical protein